MGYHGGHSHWDNILFGGRCGHGHDHGHDHDHGCDGGDEGHKGSEEVIVSPTKEIVNIRKHYHTIKRIHPTHIKNIDKKITRIENYYPVTESHEKECHTEEYDCGKDVKHPHCKPRKDKWCW